MVAKTRRATSSGCIWMTNEDVIDLYNKQVKRAVKKVGASRRKVERELGR